MALATRPMLAADNAFSPLITFAMKDLDLNPAFFAKNAYEKPMPLHFCSAK
jgi:hypothetical protein